MAKSGCKHKTLTLEQRYSVVQELASGSKQSDLATKYGVDAATISRIKKVSRHISKV